jgi:hypothetical protein
MSPRWAVTLSNENGPSRSQPSLTSWLAASGAQRPADARRRPGHASPRSNGVAGHPATPRQDALQLPWACNGALQPSTDLDRLTHAVTTRSPAQEE